MTTDKGIFIQNIYYMLSYAYQVLQQQDYQCIASEKFEHIDDLFAAILAKITREDIDHGLTEAQWDSLLVSAQEFSTECCKDIYNYVSKEFGEEKKKEL